MLTPSLKVKRGPIEARFQREIEAAAAAIASTTTSSSGSQELDESFLLQGGDSLSAVRLVARIKREVGADVPASFLLQNPSLEELRMFVATAGGNVASPQLPASALQDLASDARAHLGPERGREPCPLLDAKVVLLTGATGFLGAFLLRDLLQLLPEVRVICIVRGDKQRLQDSLKKRELSLDWDRIEILTGDLEAGLLGCRDLKEFNALSRRVDAVFHSAASVNWMMSYDALRGANVAPCFDLIRFCTTNKPKRLFHVSTVSCCPARLSAEHGQEYFEGFGDDDWIANSGPYAQSKYVAEKILSACAPELFLSIFRPANILADTESGSSNITDFSNRLVACSVLLQAALSESDVISNFTPVDYVSSSIVRIAMNTLAKLGPYLITNNASPRFVVFFFFFLSHKS